MRPLAGIFMHGQVPLADVIEAYRHAMVLQARDDLRETLGEEPTKSQITLATGLHRGAVAKYLAAKRPEGKRPASSEIINRWKTESRWKGGDGKPLTLPFAGIRSFTELCETVSMQVRPRSFLEQMIQTDAVRETEAGIELVNLASHVTVDRDERILDTLHNLQMALNTYLRNLKEPGSLYEQIHYSDNMPPNLGEWVALQIRESCRDFSKGVTGTLQKNEIEGETFDIHGVILMQVYKPMESK